MLNINILTLLIFNFSDYSEARAALVEAVVTVSHGCPDDPLECVKYCLKNYQGATGGHCVGRACACVEF